MKRPKSIKDKNEELLNAFSAANNVSKAAKNESNYNYDSKYAFYNFYRDFKKFKRMSLGSKYDEMNDFYKLLNSFINTHEATTDETKDRKDRIMKYVKPLYDEYFNAYKKNYDSEVKDKEKRGRDYKHFEIIDNGDQGPKSTKKEETETKKPDEIQIPSWAKINKNNFDSLIQDVYNNLNNDEFKTTVDKKTYDLKNAKDFLVKITTQKIRKKEALKLYSDLITPDITELEKTKDKGNNRRHNILNVLRNLESVFTVVYWHYKVCHQSQKKVLRREQN